MKKTAGCLGLFLGGMKQLYGDCFTSPCHKNPVMKQTVFWTLLKFSWESKVRLAGCDSPVSGRQFFLLILEVCEKMLLYRWWLNKPHMNETYAAYAPIKLDCMDYFPESRSKQIKLVGGFNQVEKYSSKWESSPSRGENKKYLKPPPRKHLNETTTWYCTKHYFHTVDDLYQAWGHRVIAY